MLVVIAVAGYGRSAGIIVMLVACAKSVESFTDIVAGLLQKHERLDLVAISFMLKGSSSLVAFSAIYFTFRSVAAAVAGLGATWLLVFLCYDLQLARRLLGPGASFFRWNRSHLQQLAKIAAPLGIVTTLSTLNFNVPRYALQHFRGASEVGIFSALGYVVVVITLLVNALGQSAVVRLSAYFAKGNAQDYSRLLIRMSLLCVAAAAAGFVLCQFIGYNLIRLVYGREYAAHIGLLKVFIVASAISAIAAVLSFGMTAARRFQAQLPVLAATVSTCVALVWFLTPRWGMWGAAIALCSSALIQALGSFIVIRAALRSKKRERDQTERRDDLRTSRQLKEVEAEMAAGAAME